MFANKEFLFGKGVGSVARKVCTKIILANGGRIFKRAVYPARFKKPQAYSQLPDSLTHILVNDRDIKEVDLCNHFYSIGIPSTTEVVHWSWLEACVLAQSFCDSTPFRVQSSTLNKRGVKRSHNLTAPAAPALLAKATNLSSYLAGGSPFAFGFAAPPPIVPAPAPAPAPASIAAHVPPPPIVPISAPAAAVNPTKRGKANDIDCLDAFNTSFNSTTTQSMGNGWFLLHNTIDGDRTPSLLFKFSPVQQQCTTVVGFDMDGTIITTKSGATFAKDSSDWKFLYPDIPTQLQARHQAGAHLFIVSNQNGVNKGHVTVAQLMTKFDNIVSGIGLPMDIACAFASDCHRKPNTGAWEFLARNRFVDYAADETTRLSVLGQSMYVGDAAGRPKTRDRSKDFSSSDYKMALNLGIQVCPRPSVLFDHRAVPNSRTILSRLSSPD
jgi:DNA 3'-phosphatase